jgi:hypothetical protein
VVLVARFVKSKLKKMRKVGSVDLDLGRCAKQGKGGTGGRAMYY